MSVSTSLGRIQTKLATYPLLALIMLPFVIFGGEVYLWPWLVTMIIGLVLEIIWGYTIVYQAGWLTIFFGVLEFEVVALLLALWRIPLSLTDAAVYYLVTWSIIQLFIIYIVPVWRLSWVEDGGELW